MVSRSDVDTELKIQRLRSELERLQGAECAYREIDDRTNAIVLRWDPFASSS